MAGKQTAQTDWHAVARIRSLMADRGWTPDDVERASRLTGHPNRVASRWTIWRVLRTGKVPTTPVQFEIAQAFGLLPSQVWVADFQVAQVQRRVAA